MRKKSDYNFSLTRPGDQLQSGIQVFRIAEIKQNTVDECW